MVSNPEGRSRITLQGLHQDQENTNPQYSKLGEVRGTKEKNALRIYGEERVENWDGIELSAKDYRPPGGET
ncbi:hypothetical protein KEM48_002261 [Puccinia striiformis f. sp. tritici PST-130]|nr:hypothetical protein KEM48_002261 [Puccinia striiformis f. sp. tritici PST-130]